MITITRVAQNYLKAMIKEEKAIGMYLKIKNTGCSGKGYVLDYMHSLPNKNNEKYDKREIYKINGITMLIKKADIDYVKNIVIDLEKSEFNSKIIFSNPHAIDRCGCGESFKFVDKI